jgi:putative transposase
VVKVSGKGSGRVSIAGLVCFQPGRRASPPRLIYRTRTHRGRKGERRSFSERDYADLLDAAHQRLGGPIVLIWDNLNTHISHVMREYIAARDWLTVYRLPPYAPDLNATEGVWANLTIGLGNRHFHGLDTLKAAIMTRLRRLQHRPDLITGLLAHTGLPLKPA